ncbi:MAG: HAMP domain-containing histidine kinase [Anaerolineae bacterium]|nr:HAMP domain-containing histidine kinase [Anaerolineae bacterium]
MKQSLQDTSEELLTRLVHKMGRSLGAFRSTTQALLNGADEDPRLRRELLQEMETELGELQQLLENVTQLKALQKGTFHLSRRSVAPSPWLRQLVARWQRVAKEKGLAWVVSVPDNLPTIDADLDKLEQSLNNLLSNAVRHSAAGARVALAAERADGALLLRLTSDLPRLTRDEYDRIFDLFYTGEMQGRFPTGVGLGLHVTRQLIEQHGGRLEVVPPGVDDGAVNFEIRLPLSQVVA